ncbi:MAG: hypothetical protein HY356_05110 [Gammaproteobacteria bacterium]|nr:hypothetical protein [Gammaproteobacteria bacterium]
MVSLRAGPATYVACIQLVVLLLVPDVLHGAETTAGTTEPTDPFREFLTGGKVDLFLRYRFENVDDAQVPPPRKDAYANTLRTALGYNTGLLYHFGAYFQVEDVRVIGAEKFNDGGNNNITDRAVVVDPEGTEIHQANLRFEGIPQTILRFGRQEIEHRQAPLHRYIGNILWRQNWQGFDAFRATSRYLPDTVADYAYVWNVNRIFGEDNPLPDRSDFRMDSHFFNVQYNGFRFGKFEPYAYLLDFSNSVSERFSTRTYGLRFDGSYPVTLQAKILYTGEYARQHDYGGNPNDIGVNYWLGEFGANYTFGKLVDSVTAKASYEVLGGDGGVESFQTPLGTNHAFQGWADRFLVTPGDGIEDLFVTLKTNIFGATLMAVYHDLSSDKDDYDYGTEWDLLIEKTFLKRYTVGLKYAEYDADKNTLNVARNSTAGQAFDLTKFWAWIQVTF